MLCHPQQYGSAVLHFIECYNSGFCFLHNVIRPYLCKCNDYNAKYVGHDRQSKLGSKNSHIEYGRTEKSSVVQHILKPNHSVDVNFIRHVTYNRYRNAYESSEISKQFK